MLGITGNCPLRFITALTFCKGKQTMGIELIYQVFIIVLTFATALDLGQ